MRRRHLAPVFAVVLSGISAMCNASELNQPLSTALQPQGAAPGNQYVLSEGMPEPIEPITSIETNIAPRAAGYPRTMPSRPFPASPLHRRKSCPTKCGRAFIGKPRAPAIGRSISRILPWNATATRGGWSSRLPRPSTSWATRRFSLIAWWPNRLATASTRSDTSGRGRRRRSVTTARRLASAPVSFRPAPSPD